MWNIIEKFQHSDSTDRFVLVLFTDLIYKFYILLHRDNDARTLSQTE